MTALDVALHERAALVRLAQTITRTREDAEDAVQAATLIAVRRRDVTGPTAGAWLRTVVRNAALAQLRTRTIAVANLDHIGAPDVDHDGLLDLRDALAGCRPDEARALMLKAAGHSYAEIAEANGWTYTKVNRCIAKGRARLRQSYAPCA